MTRAGPGEEKFEVLREEAHAALDRHLDDIQATEDKALKILRAVLLLASIGGSGALADNPGGRTAHKPAQVARPAVCTRCRQPGAAAMTAGMTFTASRFRVGVESLDLNELAEADEKFGELALDGYKTWIDRAKTARIANEFYLALTVLFVLLAVLFLTFEAIRLGVENWPTIVVVPISILFVVWYIIRIQTVIVGWMEWHHPRMMHLMHRQVSNARTLFWAPRDVLSRVLFPVPGGEMNGVESVGRDELGSFDEDQNGTEGSPETSDSTKMHSTVGTIRGVDLQKWVVENIEQIEEGLKVVEVHSRVGQFNPDILCRDDRDRWVVVEIKLTPRPDDPYVLRDYVKGLEKATDEEARGILVGFHIPERVKKELRKLSLEFWEAPSDVHSILESTG